MKYSYIKNKDELLTYLGGFEEKKTHIIALDIEAEMNLHSYGEKLCLVQIFDGQNRVIIDPLDIGNTDLKSLFESKNILKVMYDASSDSWLLKNSHDIELTSVLDLRPAVDLLEYEKQDLHSVIAADLGIVLNRKNRYQKFNWVRRPIDRGAMVYALNDVIHLLKLKDIIYKKLLARELLDQFLLKNLQLQCRDFTRNPEDRYRKIKGYGRLTDAEKAMFLRVFAVRDKYAKMADMPPHNIITNADLVTIVKDSRHINDIRFLKRFSVNFIKGIVAELELAVSQKA